MALVKYPLRPTGYSPLRDFDEPFNRLSRLFDESMSLRSGNGMWSPAVNVSETKEEMVLTAELPGLSEENIDVEIENNVLSISGEKAVERSEGDEQAQHHVWERSYGSFRRAFTLPRTVEADQISASFKNGVLTVTLPKAAEAKARRIDVASS